MDYGSLIIKVAEIIKKRGISRTKFGYKAELHRVQVNRYCDNKVKKLDFAILARICTALECDIGDIIEYIPPVE